MPLSESALKEVQAAIEKAEKQIPVVEKDISQALRAGVDTTEQAARLAELKAKVRKLKSVYGGK